MPASRSIDPVSPFRGGRPALYLVGSEDDPTVGSPVPPHPKAPRSLAGPMDQGEIVEPIADAMPANASTPILVDRRPLLIRMLTKLIVRIRWFPTAWALLCSIPSEARQAWAKTGIKEE